MGARCIEEEREREKTAFFPHISFLALLLYFLRRLFSLFFLFCVSAFDV